MRTFRTYSAALALLIGGVAAANAADLYAGGSKDGTIATVGSPFAGLNVGVGVGAEWPSDTSDTYFRGDIRAGYNVVNKEGWLLGVYGELSLLDVTQATDPILGYGAGVKLGKVFGSSNLAYVFGGYDALNFSTISVGGFAVGGGFETLVAQHWTIGLEGAYVDYPNSGMDAFRGLLRTTFYVN